MAGPATTGKTFIFNNMEGSPIPLPISVSLKPGEEISIRLNLLMDPGMDGPHNFLLRVLLDEKGGKLHPPLELYIRAYFG